MRHSSFFFAWNSRRCGASAWALLSNRCRRVYVFLWQKHQVRSSEHVPESVRQQAQVEGTVQVHVDASAKGNPDVRSRRRSPPPSPCFRKSPVALSRDRVLCSWKPVSLLARILFGSGAKSTVVSFLFSVIRARKTSVLSRIWSAQCRIARRVQDFKHKADFNSKRANRTSVDSRAWHTNWGAERKSNIAYYLSPLPSSGTSEKVVFNTSPFDVNPNFV